MNDHNTLIKEIIDEIEKVLIGKRNKIELALAAFLAEGHLLIEDLPGVGKTTLAKTFSSVLGLDFRRVQFTSDLLPSDIIGVEYFDVQSAQFHFKPGPIFTSILLVDEINRASAKTQSALLEAMAEHQVSVENKTHELSTPFFVIATKNPYEEAGVFKMPSSQLDRFICSITLGYVDEKSERAILERGLLDHTQKIKSFEKEDVLSLRTGAQEIHLNDEILDRIQEIIRISRDTSLFKYGLSTRGALALVQLSKAYAFIQGREFVIPDDITAILPSVLAQRLESLSDHNESAAEKILKLL